NIMDFPKLFPGTQIFKLEENYRSTQPILTLANEVINQATEKYAKTLFTRKSQGLAPMLVTAADENTQSRFVAQRVLAMSEDGVTKKSQAVIESIRAKEAKGLDALREAAAKGSGPGAQGFQDLVRVLEEVSGGRMTPAEQMNAVCGYYLPILKQHYDDYPKRIKDVEHLYTIAERYGKLESLLADLALEPPDESVFDVEAEDQDDGPR